ncbi:HET-domain-containing protein [Daldinia decipiens]|uniref:HET-domain-containing protein n=1 Tax=Daldinia decipiens TaxID=326647 RepID=UPI0020C2EA3D|nr:HET-domain-containing protein [Daldinia decipiens]KAI1662792.1 HET-domain-containing protein [Daldinia decipiens]
MEDSIEHMCEWCDLLNEEILFYYRRGKHRKAEPQPDATFSVTVRFVNRTTTSPLELSISIENSWSPSFLCIRDCEANHTRCPPPTAATLPIRVIDCVDVTCVRLFQRNGQTPPAQYAALSYVWGEEQPHQTTAARLPSYLQQIDTKYIPATIKDAIKVTRALGLRYLWVDAFCIVQDSKEDKARNIAQIRNIFRHSYITIIAANAKKVSDGFLNRMLLYNTPSTVPFRCPDSDDAVGTMYLQKGNPAPREPINARAWCLEERVLSSRALWYCSHTIQYECQNGHKNVDGGGNMADPLDGVPRLPDRLFTPGLALNAIPTHGISIDADIKGVAENEENEVNKAWDNILTLYTRRTLTKPRDRLIALSGVVDYFAEFWGKRSKYIAGLWEHKLPYALLWYISNGAIAARPALYRAPSWSWASVDGEVSYTIIPQKGAIALNYDAVVIKCILKRTIWDPAEEELYEIVDGVPVGASDESRSERGEVGFVSVDAKDELLMLRREVSAAILAQTPNSLLGIVVVPVTSSELNKFSERLSITHCMYRRIGWFTAPFCDRDNWLRTPHQTIHLI